MKIRFRRNMGNVDRAVRAVIGLTLLTLGPVTEFLASDNISVILMGMVGSLALISALFSYCILYDLTGFGAANTHNKAQE